MSIINATNLRKNLFEYLNAVSTQGDTLVVTGKSGNVVMMSEEDYRSLMETLHLYSMPGMVESIVEGINTPVEDCVTIDWKKDLRDN